MPATADRVILLILDIIALPLVVPVAEPRFRFLRRPFEFNCRVTTNYHVSVAQAGVNRNFGPAPFVERLAVTFTGPRGAAAPPMN
jgi:hypothetical protein